ncbi:HEPN domain-containing protein [Exiguobacterium sp. s193]|uniref:HEPN domain-containing protein n=1 Tax=Exiguobacterium sp. s193 TaxID=2751207 RepID=UPI001BEA8ED1|nr:HEPN domain-containing protein [Exiguobacterium sp. s193]
MKINSLINFISLVAELTDIGFDKVYFKCEGNILNGSNLPRSLWDKVNIMDSQKITLRKDLSSLPFSILRELQQKNRLNNEQLKLAIEKYNALYKTYHEEHMNRIQGALYRRTRAMMDFNETEGLLDSIIGIEQLFSSGSSELSFRLSLYVANILREDKKFIDMEKKEIFDEFKKLYSKRSKFVHLGKEQKDTKALIFLEAVLLGIINSKKINFESKESLAKQIEMIYIFSN